MLIRSKSCYEANTSRRRYTGILRYRRETLKTGNVEELVALNTLESSQFLVSPQFFFFFLNDPAPPEISPLPLHAALPFCRCCSSRPGARWSSRRCSDSPSFPGPWRVPARVGETPPIPTRPWWPSGGGSKGSPSASRSEEHTSELQSQSNLVCRLLLEKKKQ